jgi:hypothetical protein
VEISRKSIASSFAEVKREAAQYQHEGIKIRNVGAKLEGDHIKKARNAAKGSHDIWARFQA